MFSQRKSSQSSRQHNIQKYVKLTKKYDNEFKSFNKGNVKKSLIILDHHDLSDQLGRAEPKLLRSFTNNQQKYKSLDVPTNKSSYKKPIINQKTVTRARVRSLTEMDPKQILKSIIWQDNNPQTNRYHLSNISNLVKKDPFKMLKMNLQRQRYCQYRWGNNSSFTSNLLRDKVKNSQIYESVSRNRNITSFERSLQKNYSINLNTGIIMHRNCFYQQKQMVSKTPQNNFYSKAKQTIKQGLRDKINKNNLVSKSKEKIAINIQIPQKTNTTKIQSQISQINTLNKLSNKKTPKYNQLDLNQFLYDTIDSQQESKKDQQILRRVKNKKTQKIRNKFQKIRQISKHNSQRQKDQDRIYESNQFKKFSRNNIQEEQFYHGLF